MGLRAWLERRRRERRARRLVDQLFRTPELLEGTSLRPRHRSRWVVLGHEEREGSIVRVRFGVVRHPRPYPFSSQHHRVVELYDYDVEGCKVRVVRGINLTRGEGLDAAD